MDEFIERCAGLDVHRDSVTACVRFPDEKGVRRQEICTFATTTTELLALRDWLAACLVTTVGIESTGVYDFTVWLINARHIKTVPGRKTDVKDSEFLRGSTDPQAIADLARGALRRNIPALMEALRGYFRPHHALMVSEILAHVDYLEEAIERLSVEIERVTTPFSRQVVLLDTIPGVERRAAEAIIAEIGVDMSRFPSHANLASWAGMCPGNNESAGKNRSGRTRKGSKTLRTMLVQAGNAAARTKNTYLRALYQRIKSRQGHGKAVVALGHSILVASFHILSKDVPYQDLGGDYFQKRDTDAHIRRLVRQLERLGQKVNLEPANSPA